MDHAKIERNFGLSVEAAGLLRKKKLILAGDLNLTTSPSEIWGQKATGDPLSVFFKSLFQRHSLIDVIPTNPLPTWKNGRAGAESISKRLDRFYIAEELLASSQKYRSWVQLPYLSDHAPICLELGHGFPKVSYPFKFNPGWIGEEGFATMVEEIWQDVVLSSIPDAQMRLVEKLTKLKSCVKIWAKNKLIRDSSELREIEETLAFKYEQMFKENSNGHCEQSVLNLEKERNRLLLADEEQWRQKSRAIWIKSGDKNTKFFHNFASYRRNKKFIWEVQDDSGAVHSGQKEIKAEATKFFKSFYHDVGHTSILNQLSSVRLFSAFVSEEDKNYRWNNLLQRRNF
jgi:hypothetical protein